MSLHPRFRPAGILLAFGVLLSTFAASARADIVLFTAAVDNSFGINPVSVPGTNNPNIPAIDPGVTLNPNPALLDGNITYGLHGVDYGPFGFGGNGGGNTGWVHVSYTITNTGNYQFVWEVAGADYKVGSALTFDNVQVNGVTRYGFETGIPGGFTTHGNSGTSSALNVTDATLNPLAPFSPTEGSKFGFIDIFHKNNNVTPIYDTVDTTYFASQLFSDPFKLKSGDTISMDIAFLTNDGSPFLDYGIATLRAAPEPSSMILMGIGLAGAALLRRRVRA